MEKTYNLKVITNQVLTEKEFDEAVVSAESFINGNSTLRFHINDIYIQPKIESTEKPKFFTKEIMDRVEETFKNRCIIQRVKFGTKKFFEVQIEFFSGAMAVANEMPPSWSVCLMSNREIIEFYKL